MIWKLQSVIELDVETASGPLELRVEIFQREGHKDAAKYRFRVLRYEAFIARPAYENDPEFQNATHIWTVLEPEIDEVPEFAGLAEATTWILEHLSAKLGTSIR